MNFRHLLETHQLVAQLLPQVNAHRASKGSHLRGLTIVDASLIAAPSSTTKRRGQRNAQLHQTTTGNQWSVGMTAHHGADDASGLVTPRALYGSGCGQCHARRPAAGRRRRHGVRRQRCRQPGGTPANRDGFFDRGPAITGTCDPEQKRAWHSGVVAEDDPRLCANVEPPLRVIKRPLGDITVRYRGLTKTTAQGLTLFALSNLWMVRRHVLLQTGSLCLVGGKPPLRHHVQWETH